MWSGKNVGGSLKVGGRMVGSMGWVGPEETRLWGGRGGGASTKGEGMGGTQVTRMRIYRYPSLQQEVEKG